MSNEVEEIKCTVVKLSDAAVLVDHDGVPFNNQWIPYSVLNIDASDLVVGETYDLDIPEWMAADKGMI